MTLDDIQKLIQHGESHRLEFKRSTGVIKSALETACAFLNSDGGMILLGVTDDKRLIGQEVSDKTKREIAAEITKISPVPNIDVSYVPLQKENTCVIVLNVIAENDHKPYTCDGRAYLRNQSSTIRMPQQKYDQLITERGALSNNSWEMHCPAQFSVDDLDHEEIRRTVKIAVNVNRLDSAVLDEPIPDVLMKLELTRNGKLTNAAMVLFAKSVAFYFPQCMIKMARFRGKTQLEGFIDNQMVDGNAFQIMKAANDFLMRHLPVASFFVDTQMERIDKPILPVLAIREALSNAICHKNYSIPNSAITLAIFDDRLEIWNCGTLPSSLNLEDLKHIHKSYPRNRAIARVFYLRRYIETWGTGTTKMIDLCRENNDPDPVFTEYSGGFAVTFYFREPMHTAMATGEKRPTITLTDRQQEIVEVLRQNGDLSTDQVRGFMKNPPTDRWIRNELNTLKDLGVIDVKGHTAARRWFISE